ncbi:MAG: hypothetical protein B7X77_00895 [Caulobacter sp. 39-67-4]|nr:MAG: hypothetical protein B7X77_00895 [Caulobacter sp. 39-67-4]
MRTLAIRDGDDYVLNGSKRYITNAGKASLFTVMARTSPDTKGGSGVSAFLVPSGLPGLSVSKPEKKMGQQGAHIHDVTFDNVRVPAWNRLGEEGEGFKVAMQVLDRGRLHIAAVCVGVAERLIKDCVAYAGERKQFGQAIFEFPRVANKLAMMAAEIMGIRQLTYYAAAQKDEDKRCDIEAGMAKLIAARVAWAAADNALQIHGGNGFAMEYGISRVLADARILNIFEGAGEIQAQVIARRLLDGGN